MGEYCSYDIQVDDDDETKCPNLSSTTIDILKKINVKRKVRLLTFFFFYLIVDIHGLCLQLIHESPIIFQTIAPIVHLLPTMFIDANHLPICFHCFQSTSALSPLSCLSTTAIATKISSKVYYR